VESNINLLNQGFSSHMFISSLINVKRAYSIILFVKDKSLCN
jgi:hypothetical protein